MYLFFPWQLANKEMIKEDNSVNPFVDSGGLYLTFIYALVITQFAEIHLTPMVLSFKATFTPASKVCSRP